VNQLEVNEMTTRIIRHTHTPVTNEALSLRDMMNRLMENAFVSPEQWSGDWSQFQGAANDPALDVTENNDAYTIKATLPGWKPENVDITFEGGTVTLKGEVSAENNENEEQTRWHRREIRRTSFARSISLPTEVEADKANAEFEHGVLTLSLPKADVVKPKQIKITAK
jgi:HSP20 family protein